MRSIIYLYFFTLTTSLLAQHPNVLIGDAHNPNEPSICISPKNTQNIVASANIKNVYYSHDGGEHWNTAPVACTWGIWGDPVITCDTTGAFYYSHLSYADSWIDRIITQKSTNGGATWSNGSYTGLNAPKDQDKHWLAIDWRTNQMYVTWTQFDLYDSPNPQDSSIILFSTSTNGGGTWSTPKRISQLGGDCLDRDLTTEGAVPCVGPQGQVYVAWANRNKIWFDRSYDHGETWLNEDIFVADQPDGWDYTIPGLQRCNGLPITVCDTSGGPNNGTIYVNWSDQRNGVDDTDVWLSKSTDGGNTWSPAVRVNDDPPGRHQFFTWMAIDQKTGYLWFVFYDRRAYNDDRTDVYMALSKDGGQTFNNFKVSETPFLPEQGYFMGDYTNVSAYDNIVRPIWTRLNDGQLSVWTALVNTAEVVANHEPNNNAFFTLENPYPNPSTNSTAFSFKLRERSLVSLKLVDYQGNTKAQVIDHQWFDYGKHLQKIETGQMGLAPGVYFILLEVNGKIARKKVVLL